MTETTYRKTASGTDAIAVRHPALTPRQRSMLILMDGRRTDRELATLTSALGDTEELLQALLNLGFIEAVTSPRKSASLPAPTASNTPSPAAASSDLGAAMAAPLSKARSFASRRLNDLLGPAAAELCMKLEAARTKEEFRDALRRVEIILREVVGAKRAEQYVSEVENLRAS
jgi:hypothetical protein